METKIKSIKKKIEESNHFQIQRESVLLIYQLLLNEKSNQIFDSNVLLFIQLIYNPNTHVIDTTIECLINLVKQKRITRELVLNKFIESILSLERTNVGILVKAIISLSTDIEYMSKIIKETNSKGYSVFPLNTLTKQYALNKPEIYDAFSEEMESLLLPGSDGNGGRGGIGSNHEDHIPSSIIEQRFEFLKPLISNLLLNINERPLETSLLHNTLVRIAHNVSSKSLYQSILSHLVSLLYLYNNKNNNGASSSGSNRYQKIQYIRDLIDLIRFPPSADIVMEQQQQQQSPQSTFFSEFQKSILSIIYYLLNIFISKRDEKETSVRNTALSQIQELIQLSPSTILWNQTVNCSSQNLNTPILVALLLFLPSSLVCFQQKIIDIFQTAIDSLSVLNLNSRVNKVKRLIVLRTLRLSISPLVRLISTSSSSSSSISSSSNNTSSTLNIENLKKLLKEIEILIFELSNNVDTNIYLQKEDYYHHHQDQDTTGSTTISQQEIENLNNYPILDIYLLDQFIPINLAWNLLSSSLFDKKGDLKIEIIPIWLSIINSNLLIEKYEIEQEEEEGEEFLVKKSSSNINFSNEFLIYFLSPFLFYKLNGTSDEIANEIRIKSIQLLPNICRDSIEMVSIIPLFFYAIQKEESSNVILELLTTLPELSKNKDCFNSVLKILTILEKQQSSNSGGNGGILPSFILRLYCKLLNSNSLIFSKIEELIYSMIKDNEPTTTSSSNNGNFENRVSIAITIKEICEIDPNQGQELIQPLSQFLCKDNNATTLSLSLEALGSLCENEILSFTSAWNVIKKNLGQEEGFENDKRSPLVLCSLLDFFSKGVLDFQGESTLEQKTIDVISDIIRRIWNLSNHSNQNVCSKSYETLAKFINAPLVNQELFEKISSKVPILLSKLSESSEVDHNLVYLLKSLLQCELNEKRSLKTAHQNLKQTKSISLFSSGGGSGSNQSNKIFEILNNELINESKTGIKSGILGGLLWFNNNGETTTTTTTEGSKVTTSKKEILNNFKLNNQILKESLEYIDNSRDLLNKLMISIGGWNRFMNQCFQAYKKNEVMRQSLPSGTKLSIKETNEKVFDDIEQQLLKNIFENSSSVKAENSVYALIALAKNTSAICYSQMENVVNQLIRWTTQYNTIFDRSNSDLVQSAAYLGLGILLPCLLQDSPLIKEAINILEFAATSPESKLDSTIKFNCYLALGICSSKLSSSKHKSEKERINLILFNSFLNSFSNQTATTDLSSMTISGLCLSIGYCADSLEQLSMNTQLLKIYEIITKSLIGNQQFINENNLAFGFILISFSSIIGSCLKLSLIKSNDNEINEIISNVYLSTTISNISSIVALYQSIAYNNLIQILLNKGFTGSIELSIIQKLLISNQNNLIKSLDGGGNGGGCSSSILINSILSISILFGSPILIQSNHCLLESTLESSVLDFINSKPNSRKEFQSLLAEIINLMIRLFESPNVDSKVARYISICLGSITIPLGNGSGGSGSNSSTTSGEPENLDHLSNDLLIKGLFNVLVDQKSNQTTVESCLCIFNELDSPAEFSFKLPIVNWSSIIKRIYNQFRNYSSVKKECIEFTSRNITLSTLSIVMSEWLSVSNFKNDQSVQKKLIKSLPLVLYQLTPVRVSSIFEEIISTQIIDNPNLIWNILKEILNIKINTTTTESSPQNYNEIKNIVTKFVMVNVKNLPSPFNDENEKLSSKNMKLLKLASESLIHLSKEQLQQCLCLLSGIVDVDYESKIQYLYVLVLNSGIGSGSGSGSSKVSLSNFYKIKSWCFSSSTPEQQSKVITILPHILTIPLIQHQKELGFSSILNDIFDSITLSSKQHIIGLELLSQLISSQINFSIFEFNSFFNLYNNVNTELDDNDKSNCNILITFRFIELLPYYLQIWFTSENKSNDNNNISIGYFNERLSTILQSKASILDLKTKSILFSSILTLNQLKSSNDNNNDNNNQMQQLNTFNLYKILKSNN